MIFLKNRNKVVPRSTYRLQFNKNFTLKDAIKLVPYFDELGISHIYASPLLKAVPGSLHCYDVCDYSQINAEIGTEEDLRVLSSELKKRKMGIILDIVPNHMGINTPHNKWWWDVLKHGRGSRYADFFDIDWDYPLNIKGKVVLPILSDSIKNLLEQQKICFCNSEFGLAVAYSNKLFPISFPRDYASKEFDIDLVNKNFDIFYDILEAQNYHLTSTKNRDEMLNYRCFFDIDDLIRIRTENVEVFNFVHRKVLQWHNSGIVDGFRIDHLDGLWSPYEYLNRLRKSVPKAWIIVEKFLSNKEFLPENWPIDGTSGYDMSNNLQKLFVNHESTKQLDCVYANFRHSDQDYFEVARDSKNQVIKELLCPEISYLVRLIKKILDNRNLQTIKEEDIYRHVSDLASNYDIRRTYFDPDSKRLNKTIYQRNKNKLSEILALYCKEEKLFIDLIHNVFIKPSSALEREFIYRFQQFTAAVMAKGVEDTSFYRFNKLVSLNDLGSEPEHFGLRLQSFHKINIVRSSFWPNSAVLSSSHDTKRSEDVRLKISNISEFPEEWSSFSQNWHKLLNQNLSFKFYDNNFVYFLLQTLVGAWPIEKERLESYCQKAIREAKVHTTWKSNNLDYERKVSKIIDTVFNSKQLTDMIFDFVKLILDSTKINTISFILLKNTLHGVPDYYQGSEITDNSLADPDNRRPVDFGLRQKILKEIINMDINQIKQNDDLGRIKLWLIWKILSLKKARPELFNDKASYDPIYASGEKAECVISFARGKQMVAVASRFNGVIATGWNDTKINLPKGEWRNFLSDDSSVTYRNEAHIGGLLSQLPVALLVRC